MGGVWEIKIHAVRQCIDAYLQKKQEGQRLLEREEFHTMLLYAARIVNSTPLWHTDSPTDPQPICPHMLLTQRDEGCDKTNPTNPWPIKWKSMATTDGHG